MWARRVISQIGVRSAMNWFENTFLCREWCKLLTSYVGPRCICLTTQTGSCLIGAPSFFPKDLSRCHCPISQHTKDHFRRVTALGFGQCYFPNSFLNWWAESKKNLCEWWGGRPGFNRSCGISHACFHSALLISSPVRAFHHIMGPNPGRFASHYGSQP